MKHGVFWLLISLTPLQCFADADAYFRVTTTIRSDELRTKTISTSIPEKPNTLEVNANNALIGELSRNGFKYAPKNGQIIIEITANGGQRVTGATHKLGFFRTHSDNNSEDFTSYNFVARADNQPIWEGSIDGTSEDVVGKFLHVCIRTLLHDFNKDRSEETDCEEKP